MTKRHKKSPTNFCLALRSDLNRSYYQDTNDYVKFLCIEKEERLLDWVLALRIAKVDNLFITNNRASALLRWMNSPSETNRLSWVAYRHNHSPNHNQECRKSLQDHRPNPVFKPHKPNSYPLHNLPISSQGPFWQPIQIRYFSLINKRNQIAVDARNPRTLRTETATVKRTRTERGANPNAQNRWLISLVPERVSNALVPISCQLRRDGTFVPIAVIFTNKCIWFAGISDEAIMIWDANHAVVLLRLRIYVISLLDIKPWIRCSLRYS